MATQVAVERHPQVQRKKLEDLSGTEPIMQAVASILHRLVVHNDELASSAGPCTSFSDNVFEAIATIPIQDYINRISQHLPCSIECFVVGLVYIDRVLERFPDFLITSHNVHRLLITSIMLAIKYFDDAYYNNSYYAQVGGVQCEEINQMELRLLVLLDFSLGVTPEKFHQYSSALQSCVPNQQSWNPVGQDCRHEKEDIDSPPSPVSRNTIASF